MACKSQLKCLFLKPIFCILFATFLHFACNITAAQDRMTKAGTEYVRGIPVVKIFQQTVYSFKAFKEAIEAYSNKAEYYQVDVCQVPQTVNLTFT